MECQVISRNLFKTVISQVFRSLVDRLIGFITLRVCSRKSSFVAAGSGEVTKLYLPSKGSRITDKRSDDTLQAKQIINAESTTSS